MKSHNEQIRYLAESVPDLRNANNRRRKVLLTLLYWKVFDGIELPPDIMKQILERGTNPETICRALRHVNADINNQEDSKDSNALQLDTDSCE